jgi:hypothetical protein
MALLGDFNEDYTRTGKGFLTRVSNWLSFVPILSSVYSAIPGYIDTLIESATWLLRGKPISAATAFAGGVVGNTVNSVGGLIWWGNVGSGVTTGRSIGTHARKLTEETIGAVTGALGAKPTILRSYPAGIGSVGAGFAPQGPGQFAAAEAQRRGQDPRAYYNSKMNGDMAQHVAELDSARGQPNYQGIG